MFCQLFTSFFAANVLFLFPYYNNKVKAHVKVDVKDGVRVGVKDNVKVPKHKNAQNPFK